MDGRGEATVGLIIAGGDAPELLEIAEEVLDQVTPAVHREVAGDRADAVGLGRDNRQRSPIVEVGADPVDVEGLVGDQGLELEAGDQRRDTDAVVALARQQDEADQVAERIDQGNDLGRQAAARAANGLSASPPFAPAPCWWTRTMVPSTRAYSKSGSPDRASKRRSNTPLQAQRRNRRKAVFQHPNASGSSRHGEPVRTSHSTPSRNSRLSVPDRPGSPALPGSSGSTRPHWASLNIRRIMIGLRFPVFNQIPPVKPTLFLTMNVHRP